MPADTPAPALLAEGKCSLSNFHTLDKEKIMSTATAITVSKSVLTSFLKAFKETRLQVTTTQGMIFLSCVIDATDCDDIKLATLCVGDYEGDDLSFYVNHRDIAAYARSVNVKDEITFSIETEPRKLVLDSAVIGQVQYGVAPSTSGEYPDPLDIFDNLGDYMQTISLTDVAAAYTILDRIDPEIARYSLGCVMFDEQYVVATDGRRLARLDVTENYKHPSMIDARVVAYAARFQCEIDVHNNGVIAGELIMTQPEGRYPNWRQVVPSDTTARTTLDGELIRNLANAHIAKQKVAGIHDDWAVAIPLSDGISAKFNAHFLKAAVAKFKSVDVAYCPKNQGAGKDLIVPAVFTSDERLGCIEIMMPMASDR